MYLIAALRERLPHRDFVSFASKVNTNVPADDQRLPESPIYSRPPGYLTISIALQPWAETFELLDIVRAQTNLFCLENGHYSPDVRSLALEAQLWEQSDETVFSLRGQLFAIEPASEQSFRDTNERHVFESIRLVALVYSHALANRVPLSTAAGQLSGLAAITAPSFHIPRSALLDRATPMPIQIKEALMRTDISTCWDQLAGVLFWATLVGSASANPGPLADDERESEEEDARKWLTAVAVRCCIVLSFEYGTAILETLKRLVAIETVLAQSQYSETSGSTPEPYTTPMIEEEQMSFGPVRLSQRQRGMERYAEQIGMDP